MSERIAASSGEVIATDEAGPGERTFLIADVRGYTRFTRERGDAEAARLALGFADLARDAVEARSGRVIELRGDEALAVFESSAQAVRAATELTASCAEEMEADPTLPLLVGVGIDAGEAVPVEGGFRGAALNTAARLCSKAAAGQVLVTATVAQRATEIDGIGFVSAGRVELKGFEQPVELIEVIARDRARPPVSESAVEPLPLELEPDARMVGRAYELSWLRGTWRQVRRGSGRVVFVWVLLRSEKRGSRQSWPRSRARTMRLSPTQARAEPAERRRSPPCVSRSPTSDPGSSFLTIWTSREKPLRPPWRSCSTGSRPPRR